MQLVSENKGNKIESVSFGLLKPVIEAHALVLWDVRFEKEGASYYLRVLIDKEGGINIADCELVHDEVNAIIDEQDFIDKIDILEIGSPGLERPLRKEQHFNYAVGRPVRLKLYKGIDGKKEIRGVLEKFEVDEDPRLTIVEKETNEKIALTLLSISKINLDDLED